jgi:hypothetical protein
MMKHFDRTGLARLGLGALLLSGCVERLILDGRDSAGGSDSGESPDGESDSSVDMPEPPEDDPPDDGPPPECTAPADCAEDQTCFEGTCVGTGEFRVSLSWQVVSDFDLHVRTPSGVHIWYAEPNAGAGYLDVDDCVGGDCRDNGGTHVENIFFNEGADRGTYQVWVMNFDGVGGGDFEIEVAGAAQATFSGSLPRTTGAETERFSFEY